MAGALDGDYDLARLARAGFVEAGIEPTRRFGVADVEQTLGSAAAVASLSARNVPLSTAA